MAGQGRLEAEEGVGPNRGGSGECVILAPNREPCDVADDETLSEGAGAPKHLSHVIWQSRGASKVLDLS